MKFKYFGRYIGFLFIITLITLISIKLNTSNIENKPRAFIKSPGKSYIPNNKKNDSLKGVRTSSKYGTSEVQLLPTPDVNLPIIIDFL